MQFSLSFAGVPRRIRSLQRFGIGPFTPGQSQDKCLHIRRLMQQRAPVSDHPLFSVVVPMHKEETCLLATLRSLAEQTVDSAEFILVSNGEPKGNRTQRIAEDAGFTVVYEPQAGVGRARQQGLLAATGDIVVTTDADTLHDRRWLEGIAKEWFRAEGVVGGFGWIYTLSPKWSYRLSIRLQNLSRIMMGQSLLFGAGEANSWFSREAALKVGGYDTESTYGEGSMLLKKISELGTLHCPWNERTAVFTSDRRSLLERLKAAGQCCIDMSPKHVSYGVVR